MKTTSKLVVGMLVCASFVQVTRPEKIKVKLIQENPALTFEYFISHEHSFPNTDAVKYKKVDKSGETLKFDTQQINELYVRIRGAKQLRENVFNLRSAINNPAKLVIGIADDGSMKLKSIEKVQQIRSEKA